MKYSSFYIITLLFITIFSCQVDEKDTSPPRGVSSWASDETYINLVKSDTLYIRFYVIFPNIGKTEKDIYPIKDFPRQNISKATLNYLQHIPIKNMINENLTLRKELLNIVNSFLKKDEQASDLRFVLVNQTPPSDISYYYNHYYEP